MIFNHLFEVQSFQADDKTIWTAKVSNNSQFLAIGGVSGLLKIFFLNINNILQINPQFFHLSNSNLSESAFNSNSTYNSTFTHNSAFKFIDETPFKTFKGHINDIIQISWGTHVTYYLNNFRTRT